MANAAALIKESIWRDKDFRKLSRGAQCTFVQLVSQKDLDCAGLLTLHVSFLAKGCDHIDESVIRADLLELERQRFIFFDTETDELFIRSYMRTAGVVKSPNIMKSALKSAGMVSSPGLRVEVASELRRLNRKSADELADELNPSETLRPQPPNPSKNGTLSEPSSTGTVTGTGICSVVGSVGVENPRPNCSRHEQDSTTPCRACKVRREWDEVHAGDQLEAHRRKRDLDAAALRTAITDCTRCDSCGWAIEPNGMPVEPAAKCNHQEAAHA